MLTLIDRAWRLLDDTLPAVLIGLVSLLITVDIVLRNIFHSTIPDGVEIATYAFVWMIFLASAGASRGGHHFHVDLVGTLRNRALRIAGRVMIEAACGTVSGVMTAASWSYTARSWGRVSEGLEMPLGYFYMIFPLCFALMTLSHLRRAVGFASGARPA